MTVKGMYRLLALIMTVFIFASMNTAQAVDDAYPSTYTYNYDYWGDIRESPDAYRVADVIYSGELGLTTAMKKPQSLFVRGNDIYVADTGNNRILQIRREGETFTLVRVIDSIQGCEVTTLNAPNDVFVDVDGNIYIADTNNGRVVMVDKDLNFIKEFIKPSNSVFAIAQTAKTEYKVVESAEGVATFILPIGGYNIKEDSSPAKVDALEVAFVGNDAVVYVKENQAVSTSITNLYSTKEAPLDAKKFDKPVPVYEELTEEERSLVEAAESETGVPHGVMRVSATAVGAEKPVNLSYTATKTQVNTNSKFYSDFRSGVLTVAMPIGEYSVTQDAATAKVPGYDVTVIGGDPAIWVRENSSIAVSFVNLYTNAEHELDTASYTADATEYAELTEDEKELIAEAEAKTGFPHGIVKIKASSVGAEIPSNTVFDQSLSFLPNKIVVDVSGRVFVLAINVNKGLIKFETDMTFTGFVGANKVSYNFVEYIWKTYFMTKEQRAQQASFVPTEYHNIFIDPESFIYATNTVFSEYDLLYDVAQPIRRLNGIGNDILIKNDRYPPIGDLYWIEQSVPLGPSKLVDITVMENDIYVAIDQTRGRIFGYDSQGVMLWAFGTTGNSEGTFNSAVSIEHMGRDLFVLDQNGGSISVFTPTEYGNLIYDATDSYLQGDYDGSALMWEEVLKLNANYNLAFIGIGRSLMRQENYAEAMEYFEMANDRDNYGRAFRFYRKVWVEENIWWMIILIAGVLIIPLMIRMTKKMRMEVEAHERNQVQK